MSCKKWVGSYQIVFAICSVLDLYDCSRLVSGLQRPAILQDMVYIPFNRLRLHLRTTDDNKHPDSDHPQRQHTKFGVAIII